MAGRLEEIAVVGPPCWSNGATTYVDGAISHFVHRTPIYTRWPLAMGPLTISSRECRQKFSRKLHSYVGILSLGKPPLSRLTLRVGERKMVAG